MAQGKFKLKANPHAKGKSKSEKKKAPMKKGKFNIAPKKAKKAEEMKLKKGLERAINAKIHEETVTRAMASEPKSFHIVPKPESAAGTSKQ